MKTIQGMRDYGLSDDEIESEISDIFAESDATVSALKKQIDGHLLEELKYRSRAEEADPTGHDLVPRADAARAALLRIATEPRP